MVWRGLGLAVGQIQDRTSADDRIDAVPLARRVWSGFEIQLESQAGVAGTRIGTEDRGDPVARRLFIGDPWSEPGIDAPLWPEGLGVCLQSQDFAARIVREVGSDFSRQATGLVGYRFHIFADEGGATLIEYGLVADVIAFATFSILVSMGNSVNIAFSGANSDLEDANVDLQPPGG